MEFAKFLNLLYLTYVHSTFTNYSPMIITLLIHRPSLIPFSYYILTEINLKMYVIYWKHISSQNKIREFLNINFDFAEFRTLYSLPDYFYRVACLEREWTVWGEIGNLFYRNL